MILTPKKSKNDFALILECKLVEKNKPKELDPHRKLQL